MTARRALKPAAAFAAVLVATAAQAGRLIPVPAIPGSFYMTVDAINDNAQIAGEVAFDANGIIHRDAYVGTLDGQYTTFSAGDDELGATYVGGLGNDGYISGNAYYQTDFIQCGHGFVRAPDGTITDVTRDGALLSGSANGITTGENFVGWRCEQVGAALRRYGYYGKGTQYVADLTLPFNADRTTPSGLSAADGTVVGSYYDKDRRMNLGFLLKDGAATAFDFPGPDITRGAHTAFAAINDSGMATGNWYDVSVSRAFLYDTAQQTMQTIEVKGARGVSALGINNSGLVALNVDAIPYIYCIRKSNCPASPGAIDIPGTWTAVPASALSSAVCRNRCLRPHAANAGR